MEKKLYRKIEWPDKAKIALSIVFNVEAWSADRTEVPFVSPFPSNAKTEKDSVVVTDREYAQNVGLWRLLDSLDQYHVKMTALVSGLFAERYPEIVKEIDERGHEVAGHSYDQGRKLITLDPQEEREDIRMSFSALQKATQKKPLGWMSQTARCTERTAGYLAEEGALWHSDYLDDDLPSLLDVNGKRMVAIPYSLITNDMAIYTRQQKDPQEALRLAIYEFDALYQEGEATPKMMSYGLHPFISGRPGRARAFKEFIDYVSRKQNVWFARRIDIAHWWLKHGVRG